MRPIKLLTLLMVSCQLFIFSSCDRIMKDRVTREIAEMEEPDDMETQKASTKFHTRPSNVILTGHANHRLVTVYKVIYEMYRDWGYIGNNNYYTTYANYSGGENAWHGHFMPGFEALYGHYLANIGHYNLSAKSRNNLFEKPVLINTLYYPSLEKDTLNGQPVIRDYYMVSVYDEDTNKDSVLNNNDLRRLYLFDLEGKTKKLLISLNYSVLSSEYDSVNDLMLVYAKLDENSNGKRDEDEPVHIFWIDLKAPEAGERLF